MDTASHLRFCASPMPLQFAASGLSDACCRGVSSFQVGPTSDGRAPGAMEGRVGFVVADAALTDAGDFGCPGGNVVVNVGVNVDVSVDVNVGDCRGVCPVVGT